MTRHVIDKSGARVTRAMRKAFFRLDKARGTHPAVRKSHARTTDRNADERLRRYLWIERRAEI